MSRRGGLGAARALSGGSGRALEAIVPDAAATAPPAPKRVRRSFQLDAELVEELRDAAVHTHGTINGLVEDAVRNHLAGLRKQHELGDRFPARENDPRPGRRIA